jgi:uncharacterized protein YegP (UPF0339 family)
MTSMLRPLLAAFAFALVVPACAGESTDTGDEQDLTSQTGRFETFKSDDGLYRFQLIAKNGQPLLASEGYTTLASAKKGITSAQTNGVVPSRFTVQKTDGGEAYFILKAANGAVLALSDSYASAANANDGIKAVIATVPTATNASATAGPKFETFKGTDGKYYFQLRAKNGQVVLQSQGYTTKSSAEKGEASAEINGADASHFAIAAGEGGQYDFRIVAANHQVVAHSHMYADKSGALHGASAVRAILRQLAGYASASDAEIQAEIEKAADGLLLTSESDYPFHFVSAPLAAGAPITTEVVRSAFASVVDADPDADKPLKDLVSMSATWQTWKDRQYDCGDTSYPEGLAICTQMRGLESVLESNLTDLQAFYFGKNGAAGNVEGIGVSIFLVGRSPSGNLVGVRSLLIWT